MNSKSNFLLFLKNRNILRILLLIFCIIPFFIGLESIPPLDRDESRFTQSSYQMIETNDYININFQDEIRAKKPIGIYWIQALSAKIFGSDKIIAYRIPSFLGALLSLITIWFFSRTIFGKSVSLIIILFFALNLLFIFEAHIAKTDTVLLAMICLQQYLLFLIFLNKEKNFKFDYFIPICFWCFTSIGVLIKGPVSIIILLLTTISLSFLRKNWSIFLKIKPIFGLLVGTCIILPWLLSIQESSGGVFIAKAITEDFIPKLVSQQEGHGAYPGTYILISIFILWPIACFIPFTISFILRKKDNLAIQFLLCWIIPFWIVLELIPTKLVHYPLPVIPALIMLIATSFLFYDKQGIILKNIKIKNIFFMCSCILGIGGLIFGLILLILSFNFSAENDYNTFIYALICMIFIVIVFVLTTYKSFTIIYKKNINNFFGFNLQKINIVNIILVCTSIVYIFVFSLILPNLTKLFPSQMIFNELKKIKYDEISSVGYHEPSLVFLLKGNIILSDYNEGAIFLAEGRDNLALIEEKSFYNFKLSAKNLGLTLKEIITINGYNYSKGKKVKIFFVKGFIDDNS